MAIVPLYPRATAAYTVDFTATAAVGAGGSIFLSEAAGPTDFSTATRVQVSDTTQGWAFYAMGVTFGTGVGTGPLGLHSAGPRAAGAMGIRLKNAIKAGDSVSVWVAGATNPGPGKVSDFEVYTTSNTTAGLAAPYTVLTLAESIGGTSCLLPPDPVCYGPQAFRTAYSISPLLAKGIDGRGRTIVFPENGYFSPSTGANVVSDIFQDMSAFDTYLHLPPAQLSVVAGDAPGALTDLADSEEVEDVEVAHAVAPGAKLRVVLMGTSEPNDFDCWTGSSPSPCSGSTAVSALKDVLSGSKSADVVSVSLGGPEYCLTPAQLADAHSLLSQLAARHLTVVVASGDTGTAVPNCAGQESAKTGVYYPPSDPLVLAVGGTTLAANPKTGAWLSETAWDSVYASSGGFSRVFARPSYQDGVPGIGAHRGVPDVAADAGPSGLATIQAYQMTPAAGTSAGAPLWAGIIALADQYAGRDLGLVNPALYRIARSAQYHAAFHDVVKGDNTTIASGKTLDGYQAGPGWDPVTGWGTPIASVLVPLLARYDPS